MVVRRLVAGPSSASYLVHGLIVESEVELPLPRGRTDRADAQVDVHVAVGAPTVRGPVTYERRDAGGTWVVERWFADGPISLEFSSGVEFEIAADTVRLCADRSGDPDLVVHLLLDHVMPRLVALRGDLMLHASGVIDPSGAAHLFLGSTGAGKSTLATALSTCGWELLDDDSVRVVIGTERAVAVPGYSGVRLWPDAAAAVLASSGAGVPMLRGHRKRRFVHDDIVDVRFASSAGTIVAVHVLDRVEDGLPRVQGLSFAAAIPLIVEHSFHFVADPMRSTATAFTLAAALAAVCRVDRLDVPRGLSRLDETRVLLEGLDGGR